MMRRGSATYRVLDEPVPGSLSHLVVTPFWALLAGMLGGAWLAMPWFVLNGIAMGSATRKREQLIAGAAMLMITVSAWLLVVILEPSVKAGRVDVLILKFSILGIQLLKLGTYYWLHAVQSRSFSLHEYYNGTVRNGAVIVIAGAMLRSTILGAVEKSTIVLLVLA